MSNKYLLGLIGYPLGHSFSKGYFAEKFKTEASQFYYDNFPITDIKQFPNLLEAHPNLVGLNVTIPYKKAIIPYLDSLDSLAQKVGAVNTIIIKKGHLRGYNTDVYGFSESLKNTLKSAPKLEIKTALILGTGGASDAVRVGLVEMNIPYQLVSRKAKKGVITYTDLKQKGLADYSIIINTTPLGMHPKVDTFPDIPYSQLSEKHLLFDLVYNPKETIFLQKGKKQKSTCKNGLEMLALQADMALQIWQKSEIKAREKLNTLDTSKQHHLSDLPNINFNNTEIAFAHKSDKELKATDRIFRMMSNPTLVKFGSKLGVLAVKMRLPFAKKIVQNTIYKQFCGGINLLDSLAAAKKLKAQQVLTILDYSVEGKDTENQLNKTMNEIVRAIEFAKDYDSMPVVSVKVSGLAQNELLASLLTSKELNLADLKSYRVFLKRMDNVCYNAQKRGVVVYFDAEESWIQNAIDHVVTIMMRRYNKKQAFIYNTFQLYRHDRLAILMQAHEDALKDGYILGAKIVRGAYMEKERARAKEKGYLDPIQPNKKATDEAFNLAIRFCLDNIDAIALCTASHNTLSCQLHVSYLNKLNIPKKHPNQLISQLYGMSDNISFNLAAAGYRVAKYLPYGPVHEVLPYLIRRAEENTSITGDLSRERGFILKEIKRREI